MMIGHMQPCAVYHLIISTNDEDCTFDDGFQDDISSKDSETAASLTGNTFVVHFKIIEHV